MLTHTDLKPGVQIILDGKPYQVLSSKHTYKAQRTATVLIKVRDLLTGSVFEKNVRQGDTFEEADITKSKVRFLFSHRGQFTFSEVEDPSGRFSFPEDRLGEITKYLTPNTEADAIKFEGEIINIELPIKVHIKIKEAPPGVKGDRSQGGTKTAILKTDAPIQVPLFIETGDTIEVNTETGEYVQRIEKVR